MSSPSSSSSSSSFAALQEEDDVEAEKAEEREETLVCILSNMDMALLQAKITREMIDEFKDTYTLSKFNQTWTDLDSFLPLEIDEATLEVCSVEQTCAMVLPSLSPLSKPPPATDSDAAKSLVEISSHIFRFMYAYEQLVIDQSITKDKFAKEMNDAYINHDQLSILLEKVLESCGQTPNFSDLVALDGKMHVTTSTPRTDLRGFSTLRQSLQCLDLLENMFGEKVKLLEKVVEEIENEEEEEEEEEIRRRNRRMRRKGGRFSKNGKSKKGRKSRRRRHHLE